MDMETLQLLSMDELQELASIAIEIPTKSPWMVLLHKSGDVCFHCNGGHGHHYDNCLYVRAEAVKKEINKKHIALYGTGV